MPLTEQQIDAELRDLYTLKRLQDLQAEYQATEKEREIVGIDDELKTLRLRKLEGTIERQVGAITEPFSRWKQRYQQHAKAGRDLVQEGYEKPGWLKTPLNYLMGTLDYTLSPITSFGEVAVKEPVTEATKGLELSTAPHISFPGAGVEVPPAELEHTKIKAGELISGIAEEAFYTIPFGGSVKARMLMGKPGVKYGTKMALPTQDPTSQLVKGELKTQRLSTARVKDAIKDFEAGIQSAAVGNMDESKRIFTQIKEYLEIGQLQPEGIPPILKKYNITPRQFAKMYAETISESGRLLGMHGALAKRLGFVFKGNQEAMEIFDAIRKKNAERYYMTDRVFAGWYKLENTRRALLVTQMATAMRNAWSQAGRISIGALDDALQSVGRGIFGIDEKFVMPKTARAVYEETKRDFGKVVRAIGRLPQKEQNRLFKILDENDDVISKMRLLNTPVHEVGMGKLAGMLNSLNRMQEHYFRRIAFEAKLRQLLGRHGLDYNTVDPKHIPQAFMEESVNYALEMTFAAMPKSRAARKFVQAWTQIPGLTTVNPFPRFQWGNAVPFLVEHSPLGYLHAVKPSVIKKLASGDVDEFARYSTRATIGTAMLDSAIRLRQSEFAGERWYELKFSEDPKTGKAKVFDTRPFAPLSTYLFLAEHWVNPESIRPVEYGKAAIGFNRIAGTGLVFLDWLRASSGRKFKEQAQSWAGQYVASFLVPSRQFSDFYATIDEEEALFRDYKESPVLAPILLNIPKYSQLIPERPSPIKMGRPRKGEDIRLGAVRIPQGIWRQLTGLSTRTKTVVERELDRIGMDWRRVLPPSGIPEKDRAIAREMGPQVDMFLPLIINNENYQKLPLEFKRDLLAGMFGKLREAATKKVSVKRFDLILRDFIRKQKESLRKQLEPLVQEK